MSKRAVQLLAVMALVVAGMGVGSALATRQPSPVLTTIQLPVGLPAVGNVEAVQTWHLARLERADPPAAGSDVVLHLRTADEVVHRIVAPRGPLRDLARMSNWIQVPTQTVPSAADYVERMVAFDADANGRLIALVSMEPVRHSRSRLRRAFCGR